MGTEKEKYIRFANACQELRIYNKPFWLDAVCGAENWDAVVLEENGEIAAALPYHTGRLSGGISCIWQPQLTQCFDLWIKAEPDQKREKRLHDQFRLTGQIAERLLAKGADYYDFNLSPDLHNWEAFHWAGFREDARYSFVIEPESPEETWQQLSAAMRSEIRKASGSVRIEELTDISVLCDLVNRTFERQEIAFSVSKDLVDRLYSACQKNDAAKLLAARNGDQICCAGLYVYDSRYVYELLAGSDPDRRTLNGKSCMTWQMISFAMGTGRGFDFEGSMVRSVAEHNRRFGAEPVPYYHLWKIHTKNPLKRRSLIKCSLKI